nr:unnamed protein product [Digitaria exilis]
MSSASGRHKPSRSASASTIVADNAAGYHDLKIDGFSRIKRIPAGVPIKSSAFTVGGHRWRISFFPNGDGARAPIEGCVAMRESRTAADVVQVNDMEVPVFRAFLCFLYTDSLPEMRKEDEDVMYQHLLVAADSTAATVLTLAEQHHCYGLKKACFHFLSDPAKLRAVMASDGFKHLSRSCPSIKNDLMMLIP